MIITPKTAVLIGECIKRGLTYVGFRGDPSNPIWVVGEAPGENEARDGLPFVGYSGQELDRELKDAGVPPVCFTNRFKTRPPENDISRIEENGIPSVQYDGQFLEELEHYKPTFIVTAGATALELLCPDTTARRGEASITKWRGSLLTSPLLHWPHYVLPILHPSFILREYSERDINVFILRKLKEEFDYFKTNKKLQPLPARTIITMPSPGEATDYLHEAIDKGKILPISVDIETVDRKCPITIGISHSRDSAISIGFFEYDPRDARRIWRLIDTLLSRCRILGQNYTTFDANWLEAMGFSVSLDRCDDTLIRHHVLWPELSHKLDFQVMQYTREPFYKEEGRGWKTKEGLAKLMRYNGKDAACTLEIYEEQEKEFEENDGLRRFYEEYEMPLARRLFSIDKRGIAVDPKQLAELRVYLEGELDKQCVLMSGQLNNRPVVYNDNMKKKLAKHLGEPLSKQILNVNSTVQLKEVLTNDLKIKLKKDRETGKESTGEEALNEAFAATGSPVLKGVLRVRELSKMLGTNVNADLIGDVLYGCYSAAGTVTGRRASRKNFLGYGSNQQNQPKHSDLAKRYRSCLVARPGKILLSCDQIQAEDWIVHGIIADISGDTHGIDELRSGVDRHTRLASKIFGVPESQCGKDTTERFLGKKVRHAGNYGMYEDKMAAIMASEGYSIEKRICAALLQKFHEIEPGIRGVFHAYVESCLKRSRKLVTPLGRERTFFGLHPTRDNGKIFREAYSYIPQSTVGDNTGMAILSCEESGFDLVLQDGHDAIVLEVFDTIDAVLEGVEILRQAFHRVLRFERGFELEIPIEYELGYSFKDMRKCPDASNVVGWKNIYTTLQPRQNLQPSFISGPQQQLLVQS